MGKRIDELEWEVRQEVIDVVKEKTANNVFLAADLRDDLGLDSLDITEVMMETEKILGVSSDGQIKGLRTVEDLVNYIMQSFNKKDI